MTAQPVTAQPVQAIHVQGLEKSYTKLRVLRGVDFDVARGSLALAARRAGDRGLELRMGTGSRVGEPAAEGR